MVSSSQTVTFRILGLIYLSHFIRHGMVFPLVPLFAQGLGAGAKEIGLVASSFNLLAMFLAIPIGGIIERAGMKTVLLCGVISNVLASVLLATAPNLVMLVAAQIFGGLGFLFLVVSSQTYVSHLTEDHHRERGFGFLALIAAFGFMLGPPLGGTLSVHFGHRTVFGLSAMLAAIGLAALFLSQDGCGHADDAGTRDAKMLPQLRTMLSDTSLVSVLLVSFTVVFVVSLRNSFLPVLLKSKHLDEMTIGVLYGVFASAMTAVRMIIGRVMGRMSRERLLGLTLLLLAVGHGLLPLLSVPAWLGVVMFFGGFGFGISQPLTMVMVSDHSGSGLAMGVRFSTITTATVLSPLLMGWVVDFGGLELPFYLGAMMILSLGLLLARGAFRS